MDNIRVTVDDDNDDRQSQSDENSQEEKKLDELFRVLRPLCLQYLKASQLIPHLTFINEHARKITKMERKSSPEATKLLFDLIADCGDPKKWRKFRLALEEAEFLSLYKICTVCEKNNFDSYVKIFDLLSVDFAEHGVDILNLSQRMLQLESLTKEQFEEIVLVSEEEGEVAAILEFISCQPSSIGKWFKDLSSCLSDLKKTDLHKLIQNKEFEIDFFEEEKKQIVLRKYQKELLEEARKGKNCIICAPTGSGKTIVALKLIEEHLAQNDCENHKVVFLANQEALVQQQGGQCKQYLHQYRIHILTGDIIINNNTHLEEILQENDIIILTPRILLDNLNDGNLPTKSLSQFSLMIFDECHHTNKKHPYNELMAKYIAEKVETGKVHLPQIIGLTASIGVGDAKTEEQAVHHIQMICANLDCEEICTIEENLPELEKYVSNPTDGQAFSENSQCITLANASSGIRERELGNKAREKMMYKALKKVQQLKNEDPEKYIKIMEDLQKNNKSAWEYELKSSTYTLNPGEYLLRCIKCDEFLCLSSEVRVIPKSQYTFMNKDFELKISVKDHPKPKRYQNMLKVSKIFCRKCQINLGIKVIYKELLIPILKISSFFICDPQNKRMYCQKWQDVPFEVQEIIPENLRQFPLPGIANEQIPS